ncbi:hypothetical protein L6452_36102 [Arctium lappa]|uniref:Uncharacterized protein n=1 Tax=Arctium lappa TaxID=4217 RepID=A0ACB8Y7I9_ARCLA|nr:hypothetical protein L6452_36102 [Arctium lappa]
MDLITDLFNYRGETKQVSYVDSISEANNNHDGNDDFVSSNIEELGLGFEGGGGLRVFGIESNSNTEEPGHVNDQHNERIEIIDLNLEQKRRQRERDKERQLERPNESATITPPPPSSTSITTVDLHHHKECDR